MIAREHSPILQAVPFLIATCHCERSAAIQLRGVLGVGLFLLAIVSTADARYSGGNGTAQEPYRIATAADLIALGETPADYGKSFILTADIDMDPKLPGQKVFDKAVIAPDVKDVTWWEFDGTAFTGVFDGNGHTISHLTIAGQSYLGLFGHIAGEVNNLGVVDVNIVATGSYVGYVGGVVGENSQGDVTRCYSTGAVSASQRVGGLVGNNAWGTVAQCYSTGAVSGKDSVGGLVGINQGTVARSYSTGAVNGKSSVGGLVGAGYGTVIQCYSTGAVSGTAYVGGLVGSGSLERVTHSVWNTETSGQVGSAGGLGLTTAEMMDPYMLGLNGFANDPNWVLDPGRDYPQLAWQGTAGQIVPEPDIDWLEGQGTADKPYRIDIAEQLILLSKASILWDRYFVLHENIDLDPKLPGRRVFGQAAILTFGGSFDGRGHTISRLTIKGTSFCGLFGRLDSGAEVKNLAIVDVNIAGSGSFVGGLVGDNYGTVTQCYSTGTVSGGGNVGGLVAENSSTVSHCYSTGAVSGQNSVGGLVGTNYGSVAYCYSTGAVNGSGPAIGGLLGMRGGVWSGGSLVTQSFWDIQTSGQATSAGGTGKTTVQMQTASTFLGWGACGPLWTIDEGKNYPRLAWEKIAGQIVAGPVYGGGTGTPDAPYLIYTAGHLNSIGLAPSHWDKHFQLMADIDLSRFDGKDGRPAFNIIAPGEEQSNIDIGSYPTGVPFAGVFDGNGHSILNFTFTSSDAANTCIGLFGYVSGPNARIKDLVLIDPNVTQGSVPGGTCGTVGCLVGWLGGGTISGCCVQGGSVGGVRSVGGVVGSIGHPVRRFFSSGTTISNSYASVSVNGKDSVGGLVGGWSVYNVTACFWDIQTSGQITSAGGTGKTTVEMQTASTFMDAGWDFVGETANGTDDIWWILEGKDYPRLWWEAAKK